MKTLIHGGTVVTETGAFPGDILIGDRKILKILGNGEKAPEDAGRTAFIVSSL